MTNDPGWYAPPQTDVHAKEMTDEAIRPNYAGFGVRVGARIVDLLATMGLAAIGGVLGVVLLVALAHAGVVASGWQTRIKGVRASSLLLGMVASLLYHSLSEGIGGASAGKAILRLRVKSETFQPCGIGRGIGRNLGYYVDTLFFGLVAYDTMKRSRTSQRLGDKWAGTVVLHADSLPAYARRNLGMGLLLGCLTHVGISALSMVLKAL